MFFRCPIINYLIANLYTPKRVASLINKKTRLSFSYLCIYIYLSKYFPEKIIIDICNYLLNIRCYRIRWQYVLNTHRRNICVVYILIKVFRVECTWKKYKKKKKNKEGLIHLSISWFLIVVRCHRYRFDRNRYSMVVEMPTNRWDWTFPKKKKKKEKMCESNVYHEI